MNFNIVKAIFFKEILDTIRDSKTLIIMIFLPIVLYPLLSLGGGQILIQQGLKIGEKVVKVSFNDLEKGLSEALKKNKKIKVVNTDNPLEDLKSGKVEVYIEIEKNYREKIANEKKANINIHYDQTNIESINAQFKVLEAIKDYKSEIVVKRVNLRGINSEILKPFNVESINIAPKEKVGGFYLGNILPIIIIFMIILGAFYPAIDQTAGEKERGTLETLLTTPIKKIEIITGKFLTVSLFAFITGLLNLGSMTLSMSLLLESDKINIQIPFGSLLLIILLLIPITMFFTALMLLVASLANSFKDAQNYLTPVYIICGFPAMVTIFPGFKLTYNSSIIPIANVSLLMKEILIGNFNFNYFIIVLLSTTFYSIIAILVAVKLFNKEAILLSDKSNLSLLFSKSSEKYSKTPSVIDSLSLFMICFALLFYLGTGIQKEFKLDGVFLSEILLVLLPSLLFVRLLKFDFKKSFNIRKVSFNSVVGSILLALAGNFFVLRYTYQIQNKFLPIPKELEEAFKFLFSENGIEPSFLKLFIIISITAAICEEFLFRGPILTGLRSRMSKTQSIIIVGILFGLLHMSIYRFIPTASLGMLITYIAIATGSIFNGIIFHAVNNGTSLILGVNDGFLWSGESTELYYYPVFIVIALIGFYLINHSKIPES